MLSVKRKIFIARQLNRVLRLIRGLVGRGMQTQCRRHGVNWALDLNEGIDLYIYLMGAYEPREMQAYERVIRPGHVVFDIGANIGAHTLHFARLVGMRRVDFPLAKWDAFVNVNTPDDLALARGIAERGT